MDITNAVEQDEIAESLLGPQEQQESDGPVSQFSFHGDDLLSEAIAENLADPTRHIMGEEESPDDRQGRLNHSMEERLRSQRPEAQERPQFAEQPGKQSNNSKPPESQEQQQPAELTMEQVHAGIQELDATVQQHGLNDPQSAREFAADFCSAFGTDPYKSGMDVETLGSTMAKTTLSAMRVYEQIGGDLSKLSEIPAASAKAFTHDLLTGMGLDPRALNVDDRLLADTVMRGAISFIDTYQRYGGKVTDMSKLNDPSSAEAVFGGFLRAFGIDRPVDRATALKFADAGGKYILSFIGKLGAIQQRTAAANQGKRSSPRQKGQRIAAGLRDGIRGSKSPRFETNRDVFDGSTMDYYAQQHGRL